MGSAKSNYSIGIPVIGLQALSAEEREVEMRHIKVPQGFQLPRFCHLKKKKMFDFG